MDTETQKSKILVVDDTPEIIDILKIACEEEGYEIIAATSGEKAIKRMEHTEPDLILLDVLMPGMDGFETCRRLKANSRTRKIPVIFMTALTAVESKVTGFNVGGADYVTKPIELEEVLARIRTHMDLKGLRTQLETRNERLQQEIEERKQMEEFLRDSEELHRLTLTNISDAVFITDDTGRFTFICPNAEVIFGYSFEEVKALGNINKLIGEDLFEPEELNTLGELQNIEREISDKTKNKHILLINVKRISIKEGTILYSCRDITARKTTEEALQKAHEKLKAAHQELEDFAFIVSHDLKAPLRSIIQLTGWLTQDYAQAFDQEGRKMVDLLISRTKRMGNLIDGVLQYSRVGRVREEIEPVDLNILVNQVIEMLTPPDHIQVTIDSPLPVIEGKKIRFEQVFQNLIGNAVKFMDKEKGEINVGCVEENGFWKFRVADNGPGIETKDFDKIFQIFHTLTPRDIMESTGAGLTIAKKIIGLYDGQIWVESEPGKGSTFYFTLPK